MSNVVRGPWLVGPMQGSFEALCRAWLKARAGEMRPGWHKEAERLLRRNVWPLMGAHNAELVTRLEVNRALEGLPKGTARNVYSVVHAAFRWAVETGRLEVNPLAGLRRRKAGKRERVLSLEELQAVWRATDDGHDFSRIVRLLLLTGQRRDEWGMALWTELVGVHTLELPGIRTKNGRAHRVPLAKLVQVQLPKRRAGWPWLFGRGNKGAKAGGFTGWSRCKERLDKRLGLPPWCLHDLRRSFVTHSCELGLAAPHVVEAFVNHQSGHKGGVAGIYNRAEYWEERCGLAEKWAALFG